jgi:ABC-type transport system involved in cytochrome c biogenesis permease subunit
MPMAVATRIALTDAASESLAERREHHLAGSWQRWLKPFASLKLTVWLFAASLVIVLVGTLAQDEQNMLEVKRQYFNSWLAFVPLDVFFPQTIFPHATPYAQVQVGDRSLPLGFPFPGGAALGLLLLINLVAAKLVRFHVSAKGTRLLVGLIVLFAGAGLLTAMVVGGHTSDGLQGQPWFTYDTLWSLIRWSMLGLWLVGVGMAWRATDRLAQYGMWASVALLAPLVMLVVFKPEMRLDDAGLRILWQLLRCGFASLVLLVGCNLVFGPRGGNVLVHLGIGLLMLGQFIFGDRQLEQRLDLREGETTNQLRELDAVELVVIDRTDRELDRVAAIPAQLLQQAVASGQPISDPQIPFDIQVKQYLGNSTLTRLGEGDTPLADQGLGRSYRVVELPKAGGANPQTDIASAVIELIERDTKQPLGTYLVSQLFSDFSMFARRSDQGDDYDTVRLSDGSERMLGLRFRRITKPYWFHLEDMRRDDYSGSDTPRDYSSFVRIIDSETGSDRNERIWMNNPLRYRGETFYQSSYTRLDDGKESTSLQVVENSGWMVPYAACMMVGIGLAGHFWGTLTRFVGRRRREQLGEVRTAGLVTIQPTTPATGLRGWWVPGLIVGTLALLAIGRVFPWSALRSGPSAARTDSFDWYRAGEVPVSFGGRIMPLDAYARQTLKAMSNRESIDLGAEDRSQLVKIWERMTGRGESVKAIQWLFDVASGSDKLDTYKMFRIDSQEVLSELGVRQRRSHQYTLRELRENLERWQRQVEMARQTLRDMPQKADFKQKKLIELDDRTRAFTMAAAAFTQPKVPPLPSREKLMAGDEQAMEQLEVVRRLSSTMREIDQRNPPAVIPPSQAVAEASPAAAGPWVAFAPASFDAQLGVALGDKTMRPGVASFSRMVDAYRAGDPAAFNRALDDHRSLFAAAGAFGVQPRRLGLERWMMVANPSLTAAMLYWAAAVLAFASFLGRGLTLRRAALGVILFTLVLHTLAIVSRVLVTGRPPVINLYSSAVFIGWAAVLFGLALEAIYRLGIGNLVGALGGALSLMVAWGLDSGDTMHVLQAVLDTQFWLSLHVITVTLGYAATFVAGLIAAIHLIVRSARGDSQAALYRDLHRMTYGVVCFAIFFSFVGTVLGGLWADDSWGRFWGWDPKENGALMIVIWNALLLHARWDGMVKERGFALLAIGGNIMTAWSWFGTNQLGLGLHSYGFTEGVLMLLTGFVLSQVLLIVITAWRTRPARG